MLLFNCLTVKICIQIKQFYNTINSCKQFLYAFSFFLTVKSTNNSRNNMPSVMYYNNNEKTTHQTTFLYFYDCIVGCLIVKTNAIANFLSNTTTKLNGMVSKIFTPKNPFTSSATRLATDIAATLRGCVHPILPRVPRPISAQYCVICVVLPEPVSPMTTSTWFSAMALISSRFSLAIGRFSRCSLIDDLV